MEVWALLSVIDRKGYDLLSHWVQMILLVDKNALSALNESLSALFVKRMYDAVLSKQDLIILVVVTEKPELEIMITDAVDARVKSIASRSWWIFVSATSRCRC
jgi:hypothetical protein